MVKKIKLELNSISISFGGGRSISKIFNIVNTSFTSGTLHFLCGLNGSGKSTLFRVISGYLDSDSGVILYNGKSVSKKWRRKNVSLVPQDVNDAIVGDLYVSEYISLFEVDEILGYAKDLKVEWLVDIIQYRKKLLLRELSQGQKQLLMILAILSKANSIILFDEIFASLDKKTTSILWNFIADTVRKKNLVSVFINHDNQFVFDNAENVKIIKNSSEILDFDPFDSDYIRFVYLINSYENNHSVW